MVATSSSWPPCTLDFNKVLQRCDAALLYLLSN